MATFPKFDAWSVLEELRATPAKAANPAKVGSKIPQAAQNFSRLATLAAPGPLSLETAAPSRDMAPAIADCRYCQFGEDEGLLIAIL